MKIFAYTFLKYLGFFKVVKFFFRKKVLILAYHGFEMYDECSFSSGPLFIKKSTLEQRMRYLKNNNFNVVNLSSALNGLKEGKELSNNCVVITVDDGWYSTIYHADEVFSKYHYAYTVYISTYYSEKEIPVLNVVLRYIFWACKKNNVNITSLNIPELYGIYSLVGQSSKDIFYKTIVDYFDGLQSTKQKHDFIERISRLFEVDYHKIEGKRYLSLLTLYEIKLLSEKGVDLQLHTHRHRMPLEMKNEIEKEINDNKICLSPCVQNKLEHFCYPSNVYDLSCESILKANGITSATTCNTGFVSTNCNYYYLPRFLDGESVPQIVFEAEVCGVQEVLRKVRRIIKL